MKLKTEYTDINVLCNMLGCTSRTLRFYEQKGIIQSTTLPFCKRRNYSDEQIQKIREVLVLRSLGLPVAQIKELQKNNRPLIDAISERKAELNALMVSKAKEYHLLCQALLTLESGGSIFEEHPQEIPHRTPKYTFITQEFTNAFLNGHYDWCFSYFTDMLKEYLPLPAFQKVIADTLKPLGSFIEADRIEADPQLSNVFYSCLKYEKIGLTIKLVFHKEKIHGVWLNYYHYKGEKE